jgi:hypothetical protein
MILVVVEISSGVSYTEYGGQHIISSPETLQLVSITWFKRRSDSGAFKLAVRLA